MATLKDPQKMYIVQENARFRTPSQVVESVKEQFGIVVSPPQVQSYDPTKVQGRSLSKKWRAIFEETRKVYLNDVAAVPIASRAYRINELQELYQRAKSAGRGGNLTLALELLVEAEKFMGDLYTNRRKVEVDPREVLARLLGVAPDQLPSTGDE